MKQLFLKRGKVLFANSSFEEIDGLTGVPACVKQQMKLYFTGDTNCQGYYSQAESDHCWHWGWKKEVIASERNNHLLGRIQ